MLTCLHSKHNALSHLLYTCMWYFKLDNSFA